MDKVSDEHGFLVAYPDGLDRSWADGRGSTPSDRNGIDDVKFLSVLIDQIATLYRVDRARVYATGMSNGGFMSGLLACDLSDRIAAVAIVAASLSENTSAACHQAKPVSALVLQGTNDPLVLFTGGTLGRNGVRGQVLSHDTAVRRFTSLNHCAAEPGIQHLLDNANDGTSIDETTYSSCNRDSEVRSYVINGAGQTRPGGTQYLPAAIIGKTSRNLDASETIWEFFSQHSR